MGSFPLVIRFVRGARLERQAAVTPKLPIVQNGPPGTFVIFPDGRRLPLPTDQIVEARDGDGEGEGGAEVAFGGMSFEGLEDGLLVFHRVRDLVPEHLLSPERGRRMTIEPAMVQSIAVDGIPTWPKR